MVSKHRQLGYVSNVCQRMRIVAALREGPKTTSDLIRECNAVRPGARIAELGHLGYVIKSHRVSALDEFGRPRHGVTQYVLLSEPKRHE